jgi:DnaJ-class molecular chaperone
MLSDFANEKQLLDLMIEQAETKLCPVCKGEGSIRNYDELGDTKSIGSCKHCDTSGLNPKK